MNPVELAQEIEARYRRYLSTTFYFKDPDLRASFDEVLKHGRLSKGPFLEATPVFRRGATPEDLFESLLGSPPHAAFVNALEPKRPLYTHQEAAIRALHAGRNVVVATGTASGKTEAFLYPILLHLYEEFAGGTLGPGVRALVLYPMNALANDQRNRLGRISQALQDTGSSFTFTYGQYIGDTPWDRNDTRRHAGDHVANRLKGELVLRSEMHAAPPHILLTNFSMLEYLLLRPEDSPLFADAQSWTFLVLDEAHQYRGARGIEMALLVRRLKQRLREGGRSGPFRCIATSATLLRGSNDATAVATFASELFGEPFEEKGILVGETETIPDGGTRSLSHDQYNLLHEGVDGNNSESVARVADLAAQVGITVRPEWNARAATGALLQADARAIRLRRRITGSPVDVNVLADDILGDVTEGRRTTALCTLVDLLLKAQDPTTGAPLLSARYHFFLRALEGAFVAYCPTKQVLVERGRQNDESRVFEVALCRECGQHYIVGQVKDGFLRESVGDPGLPEFGAMFFLPEDGGEAGADEGENGEEAGEEWRLCMRCGAIARRQDPPCGHRASTIRVFKQESPKDEDRRDQMASCAVCGYRASGRDPVREVVYGADGPNAVIATALHQKLDPARRKILAFADGRQDAAFFAWFLGNSYEELASRNVLLKILRSVPASVGAVSLSTLADKALTSHRDAFVSRESDDELTIRKSIWRALYRECLTEERRISLEGVGLVRWSFKRPQWLKVSETLFKAPWSLDEQEAWDLLCILFDAMITDRAVDLRTAPGVSLPWGDLGFEGQQRAARIGPPQKRPNVLAWDGRRGRRAQFLARILMRSQDGLAVNDALDQAVAALRNIWESIRESDKGAQSASNRLFVSIGDAARLNPEWWRVQQIASDGHLFQCDTCGRTETISVRGVCPRHRCAGALRKMCAGDLPRNHYRFLYEADDLPATLRVEEHTAQLESEKAREFQREFSEGRIHVLSSSTTFEVGVDLGDLDTVFLRNVPPESFNYTQRVGRAGRRSGFPGFAVTYCRRGPHDAYHFLRPERMLSGGTRPPVMTLRNVKIVLRHVAATVLSAFFRAFPERFESVRALFGDFQKPCGAGDIRVFLERHRKSLEHTLSAIVPVQIREEMAVDTGGWIDAVSGAGSRLADAEIAVGSDYRQACIVQEGAVGRKDFGTAAWAEGRIKDMEQEPALSFLSRKGVIPKYGFPVDVVELDTQRTRASSEAYEVSLQRDLSIAISEFAPTSKLVANKKVWTSYGLKRVAEKEWERWSYVICSAHNRFERRKVESNQKLPPDAKCCSRMKERVYIDPKFGFITNRERPDDPKRRPPRVFTTRPYFAGFKKEGGRLDFGVVTLTTVSPGWLVVLCEGRGGKGFYVCGACGAGVRNGQSGGHATPQGQSCRGTVDSVSLGHEFLTDVLQLQFHGPRDASMPSVWFAYALAYALVFGAAEVLQVPEGDLSATVGQSGPEGSLPPIILYDNVPGGAGLVAQLERKSELEECLKVAARRVGGECGCAESDSCYGCLRTYRNQFAHQWLQRGPVARYLRGLKLEPRV